MNTFVGKLVLSLVLVFAVAGASAVRAGGGSDLEYTVWFEPKNPVLGSNYKMFIKVRNANVRYALNTRAVIYQVPEKDRLLTANPLERQLAPGADYTYSFQILCGSEKGNISYDVIPAWVD